MLFRRSFWKASISLVFDFLRGINVSTGGEGWTLSNVSAAHCSLLTVWLCMFSIKLGRTNSFLGMESVALGSVCGSVFDP